MDTGIVHIPGEMEDSMSLRKTHNLKSNLFYSFSFCNSDCGGFWVTETEQNEATGKNRGLLYYPGR